MAGGIVRPVLLAPNTLSSFYPGAGRIGAFRKQPGLDPGHSEDWIASTTPRTGAAPRGLTTLPDGSLLADRFATDPLSWFGPEYTARYGTRGALLVKLLDAGGRLPLHIHPDRAFARQHLQSDFGKTEAWLVLHADPGAAAQLGFSRDVSASELAGWVTRQDTGELLANCNLVPVHSGDVVFCPGGVPHAIGEGMLILEIQEMTDFSIMLEWAGFPLDPAAAFLGLDPDVALGAVWRRAITGEDLQALKGLCIRTLVTGKPGASSLLPHAAGRYFGAEQIISDGDRVQLDPRYSVVVINEGKGILSCESSEPVEVIAGQVYLVPYAAGSADLRGNLSAIRCYPAV
jgi:mannose-6-phosphate isomerase